jgi:hypothetical protein
MVLFLAQIAVNVGSPGARLISHKPPAGGYYAGLAIIM